MIKNKKGLDGKGLIFIAGAVIILAIVIYYFGFSKADIIGAGGGITSTSTTLISQDSYSAIYEFTGTAQDCNNQFVNGRFFTNGIGTIDLSFSNMQNEFDEPEFYKDLISQNYKENAVGSLYIINNPQSSNQFSSEQILIPLNATCDTNRAWKFCVNGICQDKPSFKCHVTGEISNRLCQSSDCTTSYLCNTKVRVEVLRNGIECTPTQLTNCNDNQFCENNKCTDSIQSSSSSSQSSQTSENVTTSSTPSEENSVSETPFNLVGWFSNLWKNIIGWFKL